MSWPVSREEAEMLRRDAQRLSLPGYAADPVASETEEICDSPCKTSSECSSRDVSVDAVIFEKACQAWF